MVRSASSTTGSPAGYSPNRSDIEYEGNGLFEAALVTFGHVTRVDFTPGSRVFCRAFGLQGEVVEDKIGVCSRDQVLVRVDGQGGTPPFPCDWRRLYKFNAGK